MRTTAVASSSGSRAVERVLIGSGPHGAQARIHIGAGALAGAEIHLTAGSAAQAVEVRLLTHAASSRQTLSLVMDEIRVRLQNKGIALSTTSTPARSNADSDRDDDAGEATRGASRDGTGSSR